MFLKIGVLKTSQISRRLATLLTRGLQHTCFPVKFVNLLRTPFLYDTFRPTTFIKKRTQRSCFPVKFVKFLRTPLFYRTPPVTASESCQFKVYNRLYSVTLLDLKLIKVVFIRSFNGSCFKEQFRRKLRHLFHQKHVFHNLVVQP